MVSVTFSALLRMSAKIEREGFLTRADTTSSRVRLEAAWPQYSTVQYSTVQYSTVQYLAADRDGGVLQRVDREGRGGHRGQDRVVVPVLVRVPRHRRSHGDLRKYF